MKKKSTWWQRVMKRIALVFKPSHRCPICRRNFADVDKHRARRHGTGTSAPPVRNPPPP